MTAQTPRPHSPASSAAAAPVTCRSDRLNDLARERLEHGVDLFAECDTDGQNGGGPKWVRVHLAQSGLDRLLRLRTMCVEEGLDHVQVITTPEQYDQVSPPINSWRVRVDSRQFWVVGVRYGGRDVEAFPLAFDTLETALNEVSTAKPGAAAGCYWYGGALVCENPFSVLTNFTEILAATCPEIGARQRELEMGSRLAESKLDSPPCPPSSAARRAARL